MWDVVGVSDSAEAVASTPGIAEWNFPAHPGAVGTARALVRDALRIWGMESVGDTTVLLVSELVTNALRHAGGPIGVRMRSSRERDHTLLLVEVSDPLRDPPCERVAAPEDEGGRGLQLVACVAYRWGTRRGRAGKTVWFELPLPRQVRTVRRIRRDLPG